MAEPAIFPKIATLQTKGNIDPGTSNRPTDARSKFRCYALVGIKIEDPWMAEWNICQRPILMRRPVVKLPLHHMSASRAGNLKRSVGAIGIEDVDVVAPSQRG